MKRNAVIGLGIGITILVVCAATIMRKAWWRKRIADRWQMTRWEFDEVIGRWVLQVEAPGPKATISELVAMWRNGREGWTRIGEPQPTPPTELPTGAPDHGRSPVGTGEFET